MGLGLKGVLVSEVAASGILLILLVSCYYTKFANLHSAERKTPFPMKRFLRYGGFSFLNQIGGVALNVSTDFFVISVFLGPAAVGIYAFANKIITLFSRYLPNTVLQDVITPAFFTKYAQSGDPRDLGKMINLLIKLKVFFFFPFTIGIIMLGDKMVFHIFGEKYLNSVAPLCIVAIFTAMGACLTSIGLILKATEKVEILLYGKIFAVYNLIGDLIVVKPFGILGIAAVTSSAVLFEKLFYYIYARKYTNLQLDWGGLFTILVNSLLMGLLLYPLRTMITDIYKFILATLIGSAGYAIIAYFNKGFSSEERGLMNKVITKPVFVF